MGEFVKLKSVFELKNVRSKCWDHFSDFVIQRYLSTRALWRAVEKASMSRDMASMQAFVQDVPAPTGELGRLADASSAASGWVKGQASSVPSGSVPF